MVFLQPRSDGVFVAVRCRAIPSRGLMAGATLHFVCRVLLLLPRMSCAFRFAYTLAAVAASSQPGALTKDSVRPTADDNNRGDYERMTQAPMVWLNLRKTSLALPSVDLVGQAHGAVVAEHTATKEAHA